MFQKIGTQLLDIVTTSEYPVSGRELHQRLGIETPYHIWIKRMCEYGFEADKDFQTVNKNVRRAKDFQGISKMSKTPA